MTTSPSMETGSSSGLMTLAAGGGYEEKPPQPVEPAAIVAQPGADVYRSGVSVMADFDKMGDGPPPIPDYARASGCDDPVLRAAT